MLIHSVFDDEFIPYGRVWTDAPADLVAEVTTALREHTPVPAEGREYLTSDPVLEALPGAKRLKQLLFGGAPAELGRVSGRNTQLNALEYHRSSEFTLSCDDVVVLFALRQDLRDFKLSTSTVKAFRIPAGTLVETYATTLHLAPCHVDEKTGFRVMVALPAGTNEPLTPELEALRDAAEGDSALLRGINKWLIAHPESPQAASGAFVGLTGSDIDLAAE